MAEKKFHDNAVRDAMGKGNATWVKERRTRFEEEIRQFYVSFNGLKLLSMKIIIVTDSILCYILTCSEKKRDSNKN